MMITVGADLRSKQKQKTRKLINWLLLREGRFSSIEAVASSIKYCDNIMIAKMFINTLKSNFYQQRHAWESSTFTEIVGDSLWILEQDLKFLHLYTVWTINTAKSSLIVTSIDEGQILQ